jgi:hypothetical protein
VPACIVACAKLAAVGSLLGSPLAKRSGKIWYQMACLAQSGVKSSASIVVLKMFPRG